MNFYKKYLVILLSKSQQILHLDTLYFARTSVYSSIQQIIGVMAGLIISYFFGHYASKKLFGDYNLILSIVGFLTMFTLPGLDNYLTRSIAQKFDSSYFRSIKIKFFLSILCVPVLVYFSFFYFSQKQSPLGISFLITAILFPFLAPSQLFNEFYTGKLKFKLITIFSSISSLLSVIFISSSIFFTNTLPLILLAYLISILLPALGATLYSISFIKNLKRIDKDLIRIGVFYTILTILPWSSVYLGQIILATSLNTELLAIYAVAIKFPTYIQKNLFVFYKSLTAKLAKQSNNEHFLTLKNHSFKLILWGLLLAGLVYVFSPYLINFFFTTKYSESIRLAKILSLSLIPLPLSWVVGDILTFQKILRQRLYSTIGLNIVKIILYILLIPIYKLDGLVIVFIIDRYISLITDLIIVYVYNKRKAYLKH